MLSILRKKSKLESQQILSEIMGNFLPSPTLSKDLSPLHLEAINEIKATLNINSSDLSDLDRSKIYKYLANQISQSAFQPSNVKSVRDRVGQNGTLKPDLYDIKYLKTFTEHLKILPLSKQDVSSTLLKPDTYDHLLSSNPNEPLISLFTRTFNRSNLSNLYNILVIAERSGSELRVYNAWIVYHKDVNLSSGDSALIVLNKFLDKYGIPIKNVSSGEISNLIMGVEFFDPKQNIERHFDLQSTDNITSRTRFEFNFLANHNNTSHITTLALIFALNVETYNRDLATHGVKVSTV